MIRIVVLTLLVGCGFTAQVPDEKSASPDAAPGSTSAQDASIPIDAPADARNCEGPKGRKDCEGPRP